MIDTTTAPFADYERAKAWRVRNRYTIREIAEKVGYSASTVSDIETGVVRGPHARPVPPETMHRYRLCCAAIEHGITDWNFEDSGVGHAETAHQRLVAAIKAP